MTESERMHERVVELCDAMLAAAGTKQPTDSEIISAIFSLTRNAIMLSLQRGVDMTDIRDALADLLHRCGPAEPRTVN